MMISNNWNSVPVEVYDAICNHLSITELKTLSVVSSQWHKIATTRMAMKEIQSSSLELLQNPRTPRFFFCISNDQFVMPPYELSYAYFISKVRSFNVPNWIEKGMRELITNCELGYPKLCIWKPFPPHTFTIALGVYIKKIGQPSKQEAEVSIAYIDPSETDSLSMQKRAARPPVFSSRTRNDKGYFYSDLAYFWHGNLNEQSAKKIEHAITNQLSTMKNNLDYFLELIARGRPNFQ